MGESKVKTPKIKRIASFIVNKRKAIYLIYIILLIFSIFSSGWVKVDNNITDYLSEQTETRKGLTLMNEEFVTYATAEVMVDNIAFSDAEKLCGELAEIDGVKDITFDDTSKHHVGASALFSVTFSGGNDDEICETALENIREATKDYDAYISAELGDTKAKTLAGEVKVVMIIAFFIILSVLLFTSKTYMEVPVLMLTFGSAAIINKGTNYMFGTISFISDSVAVVLQLALAIDYAIILCHRYIEERETNEPRKAVINALSKAIPEISGSCLTTLSGLAAMSFMNFKIGFDLSIVLIKSILISIITVFTLMPGLLMSFSKLIDKSHHKSFVPEITPWINGVVKSRFIAPCIFGVIVAAAIILSYHCPYAYSDTNLKTIAKNEARIAKEMINDTFSDTNVLAVIVPSGSYEKEQALKDDLSKYDEVEDVTALSAVKATDDYAVGDALSPREFSELTDIDIELVRLVYTSYAAENNNYGRIISGIDNYKIPLIDLFDFVYNLSEDGYVSLDAESRDKLDTLYAKLEDGKEQLEGDKHTRIVLNLNIPEESEETYEFLETVRGTAKEYYGDDVLLAGNATSNHDLSSAFGKDNLLITVLTILFVLIVLFFTFQSVSIPVLLIFVIQGSVWINFSFPTIRQKPIFFLSYLVVSAIQMGANIDYAIVITNRYTELRHDMNKFDAIKRALALAFPTVFTSGSIMASAGIIVGLISSDPAISSLGIALGRGTIISIFLVMGILPQILVLCDYIIKKTSFNIRDEIRERLKIGGGTVEE
ncbi:MAG: MMPL family transporter [Clostridia bacterium]|nr:MMPL family transporter [Clostridia bacterium]